MCCRCWTSVKSNSCKLRLDQPVGVRKEFCLVCPPCLARLTEGFLTDLESVFLMLELVACLRSHERFALILLALRRIFPLCARIPLPLPPGVQIQMRHHNFLISVSFSLSSWSAPVSVTSPYQQLSPACLPHVLRFWVLLGSGREVYEVLHAVASRSGVLSLSKKKKDSGASTSLTRTA